MNETNRYANQPSDVDPTSHTVIIDLDCRKCGYNLRTLREDSRCPECGAPVAVSTRGNFLQFANPEWVAKVARGLQIVFWMIIVHLLVQISVSFLGGRFALLLILMGVGVKLADLFGIWLMTEPDPSGIGEEKNVSARKIVRVSSVIAASAVGVQVLIFVGVAFVSDVAAILLAVVGAAAAIAQVVAYIVRYSFFSIIARRIPNTELETHPITLRNGTIICFVLLVAGGLAFALMPGSGTLGLIAVLPGGVGFFAFAILTIVYIFRLQRTVAAESEAARTNWATAHELGGDNIPAP